MPSWPLGDIRAGADSLAPPLLQPLRQTSEEMEGSCSIILLDVSVILDSSLMAVGDVHF